MNGLGAWSYGPYHLGMAVPDARVTAGIRAFKQELIYCNFGSGIKLDLPIFGNMVDARVRDFQTYAGIPVDGQIWSHTARALFRVRSNEYQRQYHIPYSYLAKVKTLESNNDPVAQGYVDAEDEGIMQLHLPYNPDFDIEEAWNPPQAMAASALKMSNNMTYTGSWKGAVAAHNIGRTYAKLWVDAGYPTSGGPLIGDQDSFARATHYLQLVESVRE